METERLTSSGSDRGPQPAGHGPRDLLGSPVRRAIVDLLGNAPAPIGGPLPGLTAGELATRLSLHVTTVRFHLDQLVAAGVLDSELRGGRVGRPRKVFRLRPGGLLGESPVQAFRAMTEVLAEAWPTPGAPPVTPQEAGRRWMLRHAEPAAESDPPGPSGSTGTWFGRVGRTIDMLQRWGYSTDLRTSEGGAAVELTLVDCPFLAMAESRADVVCGVHEGLLLGAMEVMGETDAEVTLQPLVGPRTCVARLHRGPRPAAHDAPGAPAPHERQTPVVDD